MFDAFGVIMAFVISFKASATGWVSPTINNLFGPLRSCMRPKDFRSSRVKKVIAMILNSRLGNS